MLISLLHTATALVYGIDNYNNKSLDCLENMLDDDPYAGKMAGGGG